MFNKFKSFVRDEEGATLVEYGVALIMAISLGGSGLSALAGNVSDQMAEPAQIYSDY